MTLHRADPPAWLDREPTPPGLHEQPLPMEGPAVTRSDLPPMRYDAVRFRCQVGEAVAYVQAVQPIDDAVPDQWRIALDSLPPTPFRAVDEALGEVVYDDHVSALEACHVLLAEFDKMRSTVLDADRAYTDAVLSMLPSRPARSDPRPSPFAGMGGEPVSG